VQSGLLTPATYVGRAYPVPDPAHLSTRFVPSPLDPNHLVDVDSGAIPRPFHTPHRPAGAPARRAAATAARQDVAAPRRAALCDAAGHRAGGAAGRRTAGHVAERGKCGQRRSLQPALHAARRRQRGARGQLHGVAVLRQRDRRLPRRRRPAGPGAAHVPAAEPARRGRGLRAGAVHARRLPGGARQPQPARRAGPSAFYSVGRACRLAPFAGAAAAGWSASRLGAPPSIARPACECAMPGTPCSQACSHASRS